MVSLPSKGPLDFEEPAEVLIFLISITDVIQLNPHMPNRSPCNFDPEVHKRSQSKHHHSKLKPSNPVL